MATDKLPNTSVAVHLPMLVALMVDMVGMEVHLTTTAIGVVAATVHLIPDMVLLEVATDAAQTRAIMVVGETPANRGSGIHGY